MATQYAEIKRWFEEGAADPTLTHMIVVCDTFDYDDYPVYVKNTEDVREIEKEYDGKNMQKVMEVYNLKEDMEKQLSLFRCFCYGPLESTDVIVHNLNAMVELKKAKENFKRLKDETEN